MICSKYNQRHVYESVEPILDSETGVFTGDVMVKRVMMTGIKVVIHVKFRDLLATTEEDQEKLDQISGSNKGEKT